jgi:uncharacterized protein YggU (UPF0235/DUF167 family)
VIRATATGIELDVRVIPRARVTTCDGERDGALLVRVAAAPADGVANDRLLAFLADRLRLPRRALRIVAGAHHRRKRVAADGVTAADARARLG